MRTTEERAAEMRAERQAITEKAQRYGVRFPGWQWLRGGRPKACPRVVAGKRCLWGSEKRQRGDARCICERFDDLLDHGRLWRKPNGGHALTGEPYYVNGARHSAFAEECSALGLRVTRSDDSPYYPGHTTLIIVERET